MMTDSEWRDFEKYVEKRLGRLYPGYKCYSQKPSKTTKRRPDSACYKRDGGDVVGEEKP